MMACRLVMGVVAVSLLAGCVPELARPPARDRWFLEGAPPADTRPPDAPADRAPDARGCSSPAECDDGLACTSDQCSGGHCVSTLLAGSCLIKGACVPAKQENPAEPGGCSFCDPALNAKDWSRVACVGTVASGLNEPMGISVEPASGLIVFTETSAGDHRIRTFNGALGTLAGEGSAGWQDGAALQARFHEMHGLALSPSGDVIVADTLNACVRRHLKATSTVETCIGTGTVPGFRDGAATSAWLNLPTDVVVDAKTGVVYVADSANHRIRRLTAALTVETYSGDGVPVCRDGAIGQARFAGPSGLALDGAGNLIVADRLNHRIRRIVAATGQVETLAGSGVAGFADGAALSAQIQEPRFVAVTPAGDEVYFTDWLHHRVRVVRGGTVSTVAGSANSGSKDGPGATAQLEEPQGIALDAARRALYVADRADNRIRRIVLP
jgi:DNA-binding beta-propeller fold protein YncE